jgi:hypothetical protein
MGSDYLIEEEITEDCPTITLMKEAGAIFLVRGSTP